MSGITLKLGKIAAVLVVIAVAAGCAGMRRLDAENADLKRQVNRLSEALAASDAETQRLAERNAALEGQIAGATADVAAMDTELEEMRQQLADRGFDVSVTEGTVVVNLPAHVLYASGSAVITAAGKRKLSDLASELKSGFGDFEIEVQGHTDTDPIRKTKDKYKSNWELSYDRAQTVAYYLMENAGISPDRVHVSAYGQYDSVAANSTKEGKAQNRRVEIAVMRLAP